MKASELVGQIDFLRARVTRSWRSRLRVRKLHGSEARLHKDHPETSTMDASAHTFQDPQHVRLVICFY